MKKISKILIVLSFIIVCSCKKDKPTSYEIKEILIDKLSKDLAKDSGGFSIRKDELEEIKEDYGKYFYINKLICIKIENENNNWKCGVEAQLGREDPFFLGLWLHRDNNGYLKLIRLKE